MAEHADVSQSLCRLWSSSNYTLLLHPIQCLQLWYNLHGYRQHCSNSTDTAKVLHYCLHQTSCVTSLSVVAGRKEGVNCSDHIYSKYDSWTSGYRPHITQVVHLWLVVDLNPCKLLQWQHIFYLEPLFNREICVWLW